MDVVVAAAAITHNANLNLYVSRNRMPTILKYKTFLCTCSLAALFVMLYSFSAAAVKKRTEGQISKAMLSSKT
jgi:hypothetical protein